MNFKETHASGSHESLFSLISNIILKEAPLNYPLTVSPAYLSIFCQQHKSANMGISFMTFDPFLYVTFLYINVKTQVVLHSYVTSMHYSSCSWISFLYSSVVKSQECSHVIRLMNTKTNVTNADCILIFVWWLADYIIVLVWLYTSPPPDWSNLWRVIKLKWSFA